MPGVCRVVPMPDSPENKCPATLEAVAERGEDCLLCGCPALAHDSELVSGRINTSGDFIGDKPGLGEHSCHEDCPCSPSVPDREGGDE